MSKKLRKWRDRSLRRLFTFGDRIHPKRRISQTEKARNKDVVIVGQDSLSQYLPL